MDLHHLEAQGIISLHLDPPTNTKGHLSFCLWDVQVTQPRMLAVSFIRLEKLSNTPSGGQVARTRRRYTAPNDATTKMALLT